MGRIVGIDLGTTNSLVAALVGDRPEIIVGRTGRRLTPSVVALDLKGQLHVGDSARSQLLTHPDRAVAEVKRLMGSGENVTLGDRRYSPTEISALVLKQLRADAERHFAEPVEEAVITVPAYFTDGQRQATRDAGELAGFRVERILNEPTAAALAYGLGQLQAEKHVLVYDLGGGTFDVSVLEMFQGVLDVKASSGNARLGGSDFDRRVMEWIFERVQREAGVDLRKDRQVLARVKAAAEQAKIELSATESALISLPFLAPGPGGAPISIELELSRAELEQLIGDLVRSTLDPLNAALKDARLAPADISDVVLVGGSSRIPLVHQLLAEHFGRAPREGVHPEEAVALGAAIQAGLKSGQVSSEQGIMISDVSPFTLGVEVSRGSGIRAEHGFFGAIIPRNSTIPISKTEVYSTTGDGQTGVKIRVYQGEGERVAENTFLDEYHVGGIPPAPAGREKIAITFHYDVNGILQVKTRVLSTGKEASLVVDKNLLRLSAPERDAAKTRLEREWTARPAPAAAAAATTAAQGTPATGAATGPASPGDERAQLVAAARTRAAGTPDEVRQKLQALCSDLERPGVPADRAERLEAELTELLFSLD